MGWESVMQQMMQNPAMMQQSMQMAQQMFGGGSAGASAQTSPMMNPMAAMMQPTDAQSSNGVAPSPGEAASNPMQAMMQQMMQNPAMLQQSMQMQQQMFGGCLTGSNATANANPFTAMPRAQASAMSGGGYSAFGMSPLATAPQPFIGGGPQVGTEASDNFNRTRFASQLAQLAAMGFTDEALCVQALVRTNGRVDVAMDQLLSETA